MHMTVQRFVRLIAAAAAPTATGADIDRAVAADAQRRRERGRSKLARRLRRKAELGMLGAH